MNQEDWSAFLKAKLDDRNPKCGNCKHWNALGVGTIRNCLCPMNMIALMTDLSLCSAWEKAPSKPDPE